MPTTVPKEPVVAAPARRLGRPRRRCSPGSTTPTGSGRRACPAGTCRPSSPTSSAPSRCCSAIGAPAVDDRPRPRTPTCATTSAGSTRRGSRRWPPSRRPTCWPASGTDVAQRTGGARRDDARRRGTTVGFTPAGQDTYGRFMRIRVFDQWMHEQDIRDAVGRPGGEDGPAAEAGARRDGGGDGLRRRQEGRGAAGVAGRASSSPARRRARSTSRSPSGPPSSTSCPAPPTLTVTMPVGVFARLGGGRADPADAARPGRPSTATPSSASGSSPTWRTRSDVALERVVPGPGQESVWDYPRPPSLEQTGRHVVVELGGEVIADTRAGLAGLRDEPPARVLRAPRGHRRRRAAAVGRRVVLRVEGPGHVLDGRRRRGLRTRRGVVVRGAERPLRADGRGRRRSTRPAWTAASSTARSCARRPAASTAAGSPTRSSARSRATPARSTGDAARRPHRADLVRRPAREPQTHAAALVRGAVRGAKRGGRRGARVLDWCHQRKEVVQHMSESSYGTLEVVGH